MDKAALVRLILSTMYWLYIWRRSVGGGIVLSKIWYRGGVVDGWSALPLLSSTGVPMPVDRGAHALYQCGGNLKRHVGMRR